MSFLPWFLRGVSALELLVAVAILALLATMATPGFLEARRSASLDTASSQLLGALHFARSAAILRNVPTAVCLSADGRQCIEHAGEAARGWLVFHDRQSGGAGAPVRIDPSDERLRSVELPDGLSVQGSRAAVMFWPRSQAGLPGSFLLCHARLGPQGRAVVISRTGRPRATGPVGVQGSLSCT